MPWMSTRASTLALLGLASVVACCGGRPAKSEGKASTNVAALPPLPAEYELVVHGPYATIDQHCNAFMNLDAAEVGVDVGQLDYGCRTDVRAKGERLKGLDPEALDGSFKRAKLFETSYATQRFFGRVRIALQTDTGWFISDGVVDLLDSSENTGGGLTTGKLEARALAPASGLEVLFQAKSEAAANDSATVACRRTEDGSPQCLKLSPAGTVGEGETVSIGTTTYRWW